MTEEPREEVTRLLRDIEAGDELAKEKLFTLIYGELHRLAESHLRHERPGHTLQPTALVNETVLRLLREDVLAKARNRKCLFAAVVRAMRQVLVEHARRRAARKRGGDWTRTPFDEMTAVYEEHHIDLLALDQALEALKALNPRQHEVFDLRFFGGLETAQVADLLEVSVTTVEHDYRMSKAFLRGQLADGDAYDP